MKLFSEPFELKLVDLFCNLFLWSLEHHYYQRYVVRFRYNKLVSICPIEVLEHLFNNSVRRLSNKNTEALSFQSE